MEPATLVISSRNYSSWSLRGWLLTRLSGLPFETRQLAADDESARQELLLRSSSILVPCLVHHGLEVWDTMAIAEYLNEICPEAGMYPEDRAARARCRSISGEMHSGFSALRASLPMNLHAHRPGFRIWSSVQADIDRITAIWRDCLATWRGPFLFGQKMTVADAMYAPVATRFATYDVRLNGPCAAYAARLLDLPDMQSWTEEARREPQELTELEVEF
jgi:glutathione S-transferase